MSFHYYITVLGFCLIMLACQSKPEAPDQTSDLPANLKLHVNYTVDNAELELEQRIIQKWQDYLKSEQYFTLDTMWHSDYASIPTVFLYEVGLSNLAKMKTDLHNTVIGIIPVENDHWMLKSMFYSIDSSSSAINLNHILSVYFYEKEDGSLKMINSTDYHRTIWPSKQVGPIRYYLHPDFEFVLSEAERMLAFNDSLAALYGREPISFDYFASRYSREIAKVLGYDFNPNIFRPEQTGGLADVYNNVVYSGNNSAYYPHEVVHLYNYEISRQRCHKIIDEGIATYFGGSSGYSLDWHVKVLNQYIDQDNTFDFSDLSSLAKDIPLGERVTDFRYVIGGLLAREIYRKEGIVGLKDALVAGSTDDEFFTLIQSKLGVEKESFSDYIRTLAKGR